MPKPALTQEVNIVSPNFKNIDSEFIKEDMEEYGKIILGHHKMPEYEDEDYQEIKQI